jgi:uncharacterized alkaline shock family protein YloU
MSFLNTVNRVFIVILCLVLMVALTTLFLIPHEVLIRLGEWMAQWGHYFLSRSPWARLGIGVLLALIVDVGLAVVIYLEVKRKRKRYIRVQQAAGGMVNISIDSVVEQLKYKLDPVTGVVEVKPNIKAKGDKVQAVVDVTVTKGHNIPTMAQQLVQEVKTALAQDLGLEVAGDPEVRIRVHPKVEGAPSSPVRSDEVLATESKPAAKTRPGEETEPAEDIVPPPIPSVAPVLPGSEADGQPDRPSEGENDA